MTDENTKIVDKESPPIDKGEGQEPEVALNTEGDAGLTKPPDPEKDDSASGQELEEIDEDLGITITDDELWDDSEGGLSEIPIFDELDKEKPPGEEGGSTEAQDEGVESGLESTETRSDKEEPSQQAQDLEEEKVKGPESVYQEEEIPSDNRSFSILSLVLSGIFTVIFVFGVFILFSLLQVKKSSSLSSETPFVVQEKNGQGLSGPTTMGTAKAPENNTVGEGFFTMNLDPFIIPGQINGELVFFKLKAELIFRDVASKRAFMDREAWVRDIIYSELKGIDLKGGGGQGTLLSYRRSIMDRLNEFLKPYRVEDIRLVGFVMK